MESNNIHYKKINSFDFSVTYAEVFSTSPENEHSHHVHNACEIYVNVSGDVSFMVEDKIYPVSSGNVIITRPYEYHHCIYNDDSLHKHFWILFNAEGNEDFFDIFYKRKKGENNLLQFDGEDAEKLFDICRKMSKKSSDFQNYCNFFELFKLLNSNKSKTADTTKYPQPLNNAIKYINQNISSPLSVENIAKKSFSSVNTIERQFKKHIGISPSQYIRRKRLSNAATLLHSGYSVQTAAEKSGFADYSNFIVLFKKYYGITPLKYKKENG